MQNDPVSRRLLASLPRYLSEEILRFQTVGVAWQRSANPDWMIHILSRDEFVRFDHRNIIRFGIRLLERTPLHNGMLTGSKWVISQIRRKPIINSIQVLNLYAEGLADWSLVTNNSIQQIMQRAVRNLQLTASHKPAEIDAATAVLQMTDEKPQVRDVIASVLRAVNAKSLMYDCQYRSAYDSLPSTIREVYPTFPADIIGRGLGCDQVPIANS